MRGAEPFIGGGVTFFDTTGPGGVRYPRYPAYKSVRYIFAENGWSTHDPLTGWLDWLFWGVIPNGDMVSGEAYYWEVETGVSQVGKVSGIWVADALYPFGYWPYLVYPMPGEWGGLGISNGPADRPTGMAFNVYGVVADSRDTPSMGSDVESIFDLQDRSLTFTVEYLAGNAAESLTSETIHRSSAITYQGQTWVLALFGTSSGDFPNPHIANFSTVQPVGPVRVTLQIDGLTSATVSFDAVAGRRYSWTALLTPDLADLDWDTPSIKDRIPAGFPDKFSKRLYQLVDWTGLYLGSNFAALHPLRPFDPNLDGVRDAADMIFVHNMPEEE